MTSPPYNPSSVGSSGSPSDAGSATPRSDASDASRARAPRAEAMAIVGIGCRWPGADSVPEFAELLMDGRSALRDVPKEVFNAEAFYHPRRERPGSFNTTKGHYLKNDRREFDASFFGISPKEAETMDPQQRQLLEVAYESMESAGYTLEDMSGSKTGCFVGNFSWEFSLNRFSDPDFSLTTPYGPTGATSTLLSNRISYLFNLKGPSLTIDTACSSSMYALNAACKSLQYGECSAALVAGVNLILGVTNNMDAAKMGVLSPTGVCHTFDAAADGYARSEGVACLYVKRLVDALQDGDNIRAIIRASAVNTNGKTAGITHPSATQQEAVIRDAYLQAGIANVGATGYFECHGTGTPIGDPLEVAAIAAVFADSRTPEEPLPIGSVKTNIGHSEAASGLAGVIKAVLTLESGVIPPTIGVRELNPRIDFRGGRIEVAREKRKLTRGRISVNSFGFGGANAHVILESVESFMQDLQADALEHPIQWMLPPLDQVLTEYQAPTDDQEYVLVFSGHDEYSLDRNIAAMQRVIDSHPLRDVVHTLGSRRTHFHHRAAAIVNNHNKLDLQPLLKKARKKLAPRLGFVFTGQGAQWVGMGRDLLRAYPETLSALRELDSVLKYIPDAPRWTLEDAFTRPLEARTLEQPEYAQPMCTALQIMLVKLLRSWGVSPSGVVGHSSGEIAAAFCAGFLTAEEAIVLAYYRGQAVKEVSEAGGMLAVGVGEGEISQYMDGLEGIRVACVNSPASVTMSGVLASVQELKRRLDGNGVFCRLLKTGGRAYHSHLMTAPGARYQRMCDSFFAHNTWTPGNIKMVSSVTGAALDTPLPPSYWRKNLESSVQFSAAMTTLVSSDTVDELIEIGPHAALKGPIKQILSALPTKPGYHGTLIRETPGGKCMLDLASHLFLLGAPVSLQQVNNLSQPPLPKFLPDLPRYQWNHTKLHTAENRWRLGYNHRRHKRHDILGSRVPFGGESVMMWRNLLRLSDVPWMGDHVVQGQVVFPATGYIAMAIEAATQLQEDQGNSEIVEYCLENISFKSAMVIDKEDDTGREVILTFTPRVVTAVATSREWLDFAITSCPADTKKKEEWTEHCRGSIRVVLPPATPPTPSMPWVETLQAADTRLVQHETIYEGMRQAGFSYGPTFSSISDLHGDWDHHVASAKSLLRPTEKMMQAESRYVVHPATLDTAMQVTIVILASGRPDEAQLNLPVFLGELVVRPNRTPIKPDDEAMIAGRAGPMGVGMNEGCFSVEHADSGLLVVGKGLHIKAAFDRSMEETKGKPKRAPYMRVIWKPDVSSITSQQFKTYLDEVAEGEDELLLMTELAAHRNPAMNILHVGDAAEVERVVGHLGRNTDFPLYRGYSAVAEAEMQGVTVYEKVEDIPGDVNFDLIITTTDVDVATLSPKLTPRGSLITRSSSPFISSNVLEGREYHLHRDPVAEQTVQHDAEKRLTILHHAADKQHDRSLSDALAAELTARGWELSHTDLTAADIPEAANVLSVVDLEGPSPLLDITDEELAALKRLAARSRDVLWLSGRASTDPVGSNQATAMMAGLGRSIMLEEPKIRFHLLDMELPATPETRGWIYDKLDSWYDSERETVPDYEFEQRNGTVYISRLYPDETENDRFERQVKPVSARESTMEEIAGRALRMELQHVGQPDSLYFVEDPAALEELPPDYVEVRTAAVGVNNKDLVMLQGLFSATTPFGETFFSNELTGTVIRVGRDVADVVPGDRVVAIAPGRYGTVERFPVNNCRKLLPTEDFTTLAAAGLVYVTAIYALNHLARLEEGETVLVHSGAGGVGIAAITLALSLGAKVFTTVSSDARKKFLVEKFGLPEEQILYSRDRSFATDIKRLTGDRGVDVIVSAHTGDLLAATWSCLAPYGRFVDIGRRDSLDHGRLDMANFARGASFHSFDLGLLMFERRKLFDKLLDEMLALLRSGTISPISPITTFDISDLPKAFRTFMKGAHTGKIVITYDNPSSKVPCKLDEPPVRFRPDASYLILGGLGGLGKSLITWMATRGAKSFVLLSRSGASSPSSLSFIASMTAKGISILPLKGDIRSLPDLEAAKTAAPTPIRGVFHAAMVLHDGLFSLSNAPDFREVIAVKHHGMLNLHRAFPDTLDFMLAMSSLSGILGTLSQSNYSAANCSLDALARLRHAHHRPFASVALGGVADVGYIAHHSHIAAGLARNGFYPICERDFLRAIETGLRWQLHPPAPRTRDPSAQNLIVTGLEPIRLREMLAAGFDGASYITHDRRLAVIGNAISHGAAGAPQRTREVSARDALKSGGREDARRMLRTLLREKIARLMLVEADTLNEMESLASYGLDSMIGGELRRWLYGEFAVDVSFLELSGAAMTTARLAERILSAVRKEGEGEE